MLLHAKLARCFPRIVRIRKHGSLATSFLHNALDRNLLVLSTGNGHAIRRAERRPAGLEVVSWFLVVASFGDVFEGVDDEVAGVLGADLGVEERVDVCASVVDGGTKDVGVANESARDFRCAYGSVVAGCAEFGADVVDERGEAFGGSVAVEHCFVAGDDHFNEVPLVFAPLGQSLDLRVGVAANAGFVDPDAENQFQALLGGGGADILGSIAVSGIQPDGSEALGLDTSDVRSDGVGSLAVPVAGIWSVAESPFVAVGGDGAVGSGGRWAGAGGCGAGAGRCVRASFED